MNNRQNKKRPLENDCLRRTFFLHHEEFANSPGWQRDAIAMVHEEMEYFVPQMQTR
jgi:spore cortex formation protein SpoVR/YcgB (stage V sporulation)